MVVPAGIRSQGAPAAAVRSSARSSGSVVMTSSRLANCHSPRGRSAVDKKGMPSPLAFGAYLTEYSDVFRLAGPQPLLRPALGLLGRLRGYRPAQASER